MEGWRDEHAQVSEQVEASPAVSSLLLDLGIFFSAVSDLLFLSRLLGPFSSV